MRGNTQLIALINDSDVDISGQELSFIFAAVAKDQTPTDGIIHGFFDVIGRALIDYIEALNADACENIGGEI